MPFIVNEYTEETRPGKLEFPDGSVLNFHYRPNAYTPKHEKLVQEARYNVDTTAGDIFKASLLPLLESWDVVNRVKKTVKGVPTYEDVPVPITAEGLDEIPIQILSDLVRKIGEGVSPGEAKDEDSTGSFG